MRSTVIAMSALLVMSPGLAGAAPQDSNMSAAERSNAEVMSSLGIAQLRQRASDGDARAMSELGARLGRGDGVPQDIAEAIKLLTSAAEKNDPDGLYYLGTAYANGAGVEKESARAQQLFDKAAALGHAESQYLVGMRLSSGPAPDWKAAVPYFWRSADQGLPGAEFMMGYIHHMGYGVDKNPETAAYWYRRTINRTPNPRATVNLRRLIDAGAVQWQAGDPGQPKGASAPPVSVGTPRVSPPASSAALPRPEVPTVSNYKPVVINGMTFTAEATGNGVTGFVDSTKSASCDISIVFTYLDLTVGERENGETVCKASIVAGRNTVCTFSHRLVAEAKIQEPVVATCQ